mgnify:CR=1 FL=1
MFMVNEIVRLSNKEKKHTKFGISTINTSKGDVEKCTWKCHDDTNYCKENHVKFLKPYFEYTDPIYFGVIGLLKKTGNYSLANIIFLVILIPFFIWLFLIKSLDIQDQLKVSKKHNEFFS